VNSEYITAWTGLHFGVLLIMDIRILYSSQSQAFSASREDMVVVEEKDNI
jgi:hypothetical protein